MFVSDCLCHLMRSIRIMSSGPSGSVRATKTRQASAALSGGCDGYTHDELVVGHAATATAIAIANANANAPTRFGPGHEPVRRRCPPAGSSLAIPSAALPRSAVAWNDLEAASSSLGGLRFGTEAMQTSCARTSGRSPSPSPSLSLSICQSKHKHDLGEDAAACNE